MLARVPAARLLLAGRSAPARLPAGVTAVGWQPDLADCYAGAAAVVAPARAGAGTQLKVIDAVAHGRVVVLPPFGAASLPGAARQVCPVGSDLAAGLVDLLVGVDDRHRRERALLGVRCSWADAVAPLVDWLDGRVNGG